MSDEIVVDTEGRVVVLPLDFRMIASGDIVVAPKSEWISLHLHDDGTVTWIPHPSEMPVEDDPKLCEHGRRRIGAHYACPVVPVEDDANDDLDNIGGIPEPGSPPWGLDDYGEKA